MRKLLTGVEVQGLFNIGASDLKACRRDGIDCLLIDGQYYYSYDDIVKFLS